MEKTSKLQKNAFICFVGIDGSGKTLQAEKLVERLNEHGVKAAYLWCRYSPRILMPLKWLFRKRVGLKKGGSDYSGFTLSKRGILSKPGLGWLWLNLSLLEYLIQSSWTIRRRQRGARILVCDRYIYDMLSDTAINLSKSGDGLDDLTGHPLVRLFRKPDRVFFLDVPPAVAMQRKNDPNVMGEQYLIDRAKIYSTLSDKLGFERIDGTKSIDEIADAIFETITGSEK